ESSAAALNRTAPDGSPSKAPAKATGGVNVGQRSTVVAQHVSSPSETSRPGAAEPSGDARKGHGHLADLDLGAGGRGGARHGLRPRGTGLQARRQPGHHR